MSAVSISWLTGYAQVELENQIDIDVDVDNFFNEFECCILS